MHILITGANRGLGLEFVKQYLEAGEQVTATCRQLDQARDLQSLKEAYPNKLQILPLDVGDGESVRNLSKALKGKVVDILVNNAGAYAGKGEGFGNLGYEDWLENLAINTLGPIRVAEALKDNVLASEHKKFVFITSKMGSIGDNQGGGAYQYRSSKAALNAAAKSMARDLREDGAIILMMHPGWVVTDMGGPDAMIKPPESISGMRKVIDVAALDDSGGFYTYAGETVPW
ncbi:MAG: short-chain dehydrogenase [Waddliaceae bacterium]|nr:short-chain dehydrogenase [Waddliaceae bacterium]